MMGKMNKKGVTLIEILVVFLLLFLFVTGAVIGGRRFGVLGYPLGAIGLIASFFLVALFLSLIEHLAVGGIPRIPRCRRGVCRKRDYSVVNISEGRWGFRCKCGDTYNKLGRRFVSLSDEGIETPYLKWIPFRGWRKETKEETQQ